MAVFELSTHPYGCRVLQRCFEFLPESQTRPLLDEMHQFVHNLVLDSFGNYGSSLSLPLVISVLSYMLSSSCYSIAVVQFVLERGAPEDRQKIIDKLQGQILHMARHKFASNVCEKALITSPPSTRALLIEEILTPILAPVTPTASLSSSPSSPSNASPTNPIAEPSRPSTTLPPPPSPISILLKDSFGNYLLQTALKTAEGEQRERLVNEVRPVLIQMRKFSASAYSKHLVASASVSNLLPVPPLRDQGTDR
jgi:pumilio RNA-binding family